MNTVNHPVVSRQGCPSCSFMADHTDGMNVHLEHRDITFLAISRATLAEIERFRSRMGWRFKWVSSHGSDFNYDFGVSFTPEEKAKGEVYYNYAMQPRRPWATSGLVPPCPRCCVHPPLPPCS